MERNALEQFVLQARAFALLPEEGRRYLAGEAMVRSYKPGEIVGGQGTTGGFLFGVMEGRLRGLKFSPEGQRLIITYMERNQWSGFYWIAADPGGAVMDVEAAEPTLCALISRDAIREAGRRWPQLYESLYEELIRSTRWLFARLELIVAHPLNVRVALTILGLLQIHHRQTPEGLALDVKISQRELAASAFCSRQHFNKVMREWTARGIVSIPEKQKLIVHDLNALLEEARASGFMS